MPYTCPQTSTVAWVRHRVTVWNTCLKRLIRVHGHQLVVDIEQQQLVTPSDWCGWNGEGVPETMNGKTWLVTDERKTYHGSSILINNFPSSPRVTKGTVYTESVWRMLYIFLGRQNGIIVISNSTYTCFLLKCVSLQWGHMSVVACQITCNSIVCQQYVKANIKKESYESNKI